MTFFRFEENDIINSHISAFPSYNVQKNGDQFTGSINLEKPFLTSSMESRVYTGFSLKEGGVVEKTSPFTASISVIDAELDATNKQLYDSILILYNYYSLVNTDYTSNFTGSATSRFRVMVIPEIYYDREILSGSLTASDVDNAGQARNLYDNGRGGIYSGSLTGTLVGNIFPAEGLIVLKGGGLNDESNSNEFGKDSSTNHKWSLQFKGTSTIPTKIFRCRAAAGELNASTNETYYRVPVTGSGEDYIGEKIRVLSSSFTYVTGIGLYDDRYNLVATCKLASPIRKNESDNVLFKIRLDF